MKLGGSVLTDKSRYRTLRADMLDRLARELATSPQALVVVHGAGSFGHVLAKQHRLALGSEGTTEQRAAFGRVLADVRELGAALTRALCDAGRPAVWHATYDLGRLDAGHLLSFAHQPLRDSLAAGFTPVLGGDGALDATRGFGILGGDVLMAELARALRPERAVFVTDVDGIHDRDPAEPGARLLPRIAPTVRVGDSSRHQDVTGAMAGKVARAREVARSGIPVHVINGTIPSRLSDLLSGEAVVGTVVEA